MQVYTNLKISKRKVYFGQYIALFSFSGSQPVVHDLKWVTHQFPKVLQITEEKSKLKQ